MSLDQNGAHLFRSCCCRIPAMSRKPYRSYCTRCGITFISHHSVLRTILEIYILHMNQECNFLCKINLMRKREKYSGFTLKICLRLLKNYIFYTHVCGTEYFHTLCHHLCRSYPGLEMVMASSKIALG